MKINYAKVRGWVRLQIILNKWLSFKDGFGLWGYHLKYCSAKGSEKACVIYPQKEYWVYWFTDKDDAHNFTKKNQLSWHG